MPSSQYRKQREVHYELAPPARRGPVSACKVLFAVIVALLIVTMIVVTAYALFYVYLRPTSTVPQYTRGEDLPAAPATVRRPPPSAPRRRLELILVHHQDNPERANDVAKYLNNSLAELLDREPIFQEYTLRQLSSSVLRSSRNGQMILEVKADPQIFRPSTTVVYLSEILPLTAPDLWQMLKGEHKICSDLTHCVEICVVPLNPGNVPNITPPNTGYNELGVEVPDLNDHAQHSTIYRQVDNQQVSLTRWRKKCLL